MMTSHLGHACLAFYFFLYSVPIDSARMNIAILWNVGQGQWLTIVSRRHCSHIDMGGEKLNTRQPKKICQSFKNRLYLSHSDQDHIKYIEWGQRQLPELCLNAPPREKLNKRKSRIIKSLSMCKDHQTHSHGFIHEIEFDLQSKFANDLSRVYVIDSQINKTLVPGDSTVHAENIWLHSLGSTKTNIRLLILGHHGSHTSTGQKLLNELPNLKMALVSARYRRYHHPNPKVLRRLKKKGIPTIKTEDWGNIVFEIE